MKNDILKNLKTLFNLGGGSLEAPETDVSAEFEDIIDDEATIDSLLLSGVGGNNSDCYRWDEACSATK